MTVCDPSGPVVTTGSRGVSIFTSKSTSPASTCVPTAVCTSFTVPAAVTRAGTASSATIDPVTRTSFTIVPVATAVTGSLSSPVGTAGSAAVASPLGKNASLTSATAIAAITTILRTGNTQRRITPICCCLSSAGPLARNCSVRGRALGRACGHASMTSGTIIGRRR